ncbi:helix-turn-helix transcriptional regulator [Nocardia huaxiensis]|uniref:Helix-turn-helix transcriptional regulator n=1 Tax=Nocardia huaxiensis TaxID=2755382 RepID=A0A7D6Z387_9NOCA|nr:helix-turn-helix transcriptional regulator [Nocardia huaxiensis]QLY31766.1 helix-turn-helix transcriptional regulator [Nocardia huaxiensis]UFS95327.1 helix-turn-helix transcriptional regulator [Nocardia huaxiensis]
MTTLDDLFDPASLHGRAYAVLVQHPRSTALEVAERLGSPPRVAEAALEALCHLDAAVRLAEPNGVVRWDAHAPEALSEAETRRRSRDMLRMQSAAARLGETFRSVRRTTDADGAVVAVYERRQLLADFEDLQHTAHSNVKVVERGPFLSDVDTEERLFELKSARIQAGIDYRTLYQETIYQDPERLRHVLATNAVGAQARTLPDPPMKLILADDRRAVLVLHTDERRGDPMGVRVGPSPTLDLLVKTFDALWSMATPISVNPAEALDERDRAILTLMSMGATDDTIARRLGLSRRTVVRRTASLLERLGASTRFQAGVQATRRGWL